MSEQLSRFDAWIKEGGPSAFVLREFLQPAAGLGEVIFPPTFASEGYVIDGEGGDNVCLIDSVGSQANRLEPVFKLAAYRSLVPQIEIRVQERVVNLLDLGHRAADALARSTSLAGELQAAFAASDGGNAEALAKIAPTTLVFGAWDSRGTQAKVPRLIDSTIRAFHVAKLRRGAQYVKSLENEEIEQLMGVDIEKQKDQLSQLGFLDAPSGLTHGGVIVKGDIVRTTVVNLTALRALGGSAELRRYILGLTLVAALAPADLFLRQGCLLVSDSQRKIERTLVYRDGRSEPFGTATDVEAFAKVAAEAFGVGESRAVDFDPKAANAALAGLTDKKAAKRAKKGVKP